MTATRILVLIVFSTTSLQAWQDSCDVLQTHTGAKMLYAETLVTHGADEAEQNGVAMQWRVNDMHVWNTPITHTPRI